MKETTRSFKEVSMAEYLKVLKHKAKNFKEAENNYSIQNYNTRQYIIVCSTVEDNTYWCTIQTSPIQRNTVQYNTIQYNTS